MEGSRVDKLQMARKETPVSLARVDSGDKWMEKSEWETEVPTGQAPV